jgi:hypothetical protein
VYRKSVTVASAGRRIEAPALRQVDLAAPGLLPARPLPLAVSASDEWDRRFLGDAIDLGRDLQQQSAGFSAQLSATGTTADDYRRLLPGLDSVDTFDDTLLRTGLAAPGERLVGAAIALHGTRGAFADRWHAAMSFRSDGADWGLVALDNGVTSEPVLDDLELAISRFAARLEVAVRPITRTTAPPPVTPPAAPPDSSPEPTIPPAPTPEPEPETPESPVQLPDLNTGVPILDALVDPLVATVNGVLNGLLGRPPG